MFQDEEFNVCLVDHEGLGANPIKIFYINSLLFAGINQISLVTIFSF